MREFIGSVDDLVGDCEDCAIIINSKEVSHIFEREDADFIPEELLNANVKDFKYLPSGSVNNRVPILEINI